jgi:hypothetical protein
MTGDSTLEDGHFARIGGQIAGLMKVSRHQPITKGHGLGIILGASSVSQGIDPVRLDLGTAPMRWLSLYGNGANTEDLLTLYELTDWAGLRPGVIVLGIHPGLLARTDVYLSDDTSIHATALVRDLRSFHPSLALTDLEHLVLGPLNRAFPNRTRANQRAREAIQLTRIHFFRSMGLGVDSLFAPDPRPWSAPIQWPGTGRKPASLIEWQLGEFRKKGWFDPGAYVPEGRNAKSLAKLIKDADAEHSRVVIVLLPESTIIRSIVPKEADRCLTTVLERHLDGHVPRVLDYRAALPDRLFLDSIHADDDGRALLTDRLARDLSVLRQ